MKRVFASLMLVGALSFGAAPAVMAQDSAATAAVTAVDSAVATAVDSTVTASAAAIDEGVEEKPFHQSIKEKFIEGGWEWMTPLLVCLIIGLAIVVQKIISLALARTNSKKMLARIEEALNQGGIDAALEVTKSTRGPVASIFTQGLVRHSEGIEAVEKAVGAYGGVEMAKLEGGLSWVALFIALAPMLGFMGTVVGMVGAFDAIEAAGDISPTLVAGGIKVALLTTIGGLIVAVILQIFYNYIVSVVDKIVIDMEEASVSLIDLLVAHSMTKK